MDWNPEHCLGKQALYPLSKSQPPGIHEPSHKYCHLLSQYQECVFSQRAFWLWMTEASSPVYAPGTISRHPALNQGPFAQRQHAVNFCCGWGFLTTPHKSSGWLPSEHWDLLTSSLLVQEPWFWTRWRAGCSEVTDSPLPFQLKKIVLICSNILESILKSYIFVSFEMTAVLFYFYLFIFF